MQRNLTLNPPQEKGQTHESAKLHDLKPGILSNYELQDCACGAHVCVAKNKQTSTKFQSLKCNVDLCTVLCFRIYYTEVHF